MLLHAQVRWVAKGTCASGRLGSLYSLAVGAVAQVFDRSAHVNQPVVDF